MIDQEIPFTDPEGIIHPKLEPSQQLEREQLIKRLRDIREELFEIKGWDVDRLLGYFLYQKLLEVRADLLEIIKRGDKIGKRTGSTSETPSGQNS